MRKNTSKSEFVALLCFVATGILIVTNGFLGRVVAQTEPGVDVYSKIEPIGEVLDRILEEYYTTPDVDKVVEGALQGMLVSLDKHSSYISPEELKAMTEETEGEFEGIGVSIRQEEDGSIIIFQPIPDSPAAKAGLKPFDRLVKIDGVSTEGMDRADAAKLIRGPRGTTVVLMVERGWQGEDAKPETILVPVKRGTIPLESVREARLLDKGVGYIRISDFNKHTAEEIAKRVQAFLPQGMTSLILDLRWNPGGLLSASKEVSELFLPKNSLVTYTEGRKHGNVKSDADVTLFTEKPPVLPETFPIVLLVNQDTASSSEIVTGALQFWSRALVIGTNTYGKGSVQTIIPLHRPENSALRLTTALYYTPAKVTIHNHGIKPDIEVPMDIEAQNALGKQMLASYETDPSMVHRQNHGGVTGDEVKEGTVEDIQLKKAVEIIQEDPVFANLLQKYHKDVQETQVANDTKAQESQGRGVISPNATQENPAAPATPETPAAPATPEAAPATPETPAAPVTPEAPPATPETPAAPPATPESAPSENSNQ